MDALCIETDMVEGRRVSSNYCLKSLFKVKTKDCINCESFKRIDELTGGEL